MRQNLPEPIKQAIRYVGPFFVIFGIVSGTINCVVLSQHRMKQSKIRFYLVAQSIVDVLVLGISLTDFTLRHAFHTDLHCLSPVLCKLWPFLERSIRQLASWVVVGISVERLAGCLFPIAYFVSRHKHRPISFIVAVFLLAGTNAPSFYYNELILYNAEASINTTGNGNQTENEAYNKTPNAPLFPTKLCVLTNEYYQTSFVVFYSLFWCIPLLFLIGANLYFAKWLHNRHLWQKRLHITVPNSADGLKRSLRTILILSVCFFICLTPLSICEISQLSRTSSLLTTGATGSIHEVYSINEAFPASCVALQLFSYFFYAAKFVLYMCVVTDFRKDFLNVLRKYNCFSYRDHRRREPTDLYIGMKRINIERK